MHMHAGQRYDWLGEDNPENFENALRAPESRTKLATSGWLEKQIEYKFNQDGFRSPEFDQEHPHLCAFGCSFTFGVAIREEEIYCNLVANELGVTCYNFGVTGGSDDTSWRLARTWLPRLHPRLVIYQQTFEQRFEIIDDRQHATVMGINAALGGKVAVGQGDLYKTWMTNEVNWQVNAEKNLMAIKNLCHDLAIKLIVIRYEDFFKRTDDCSRDLHHPSPDVNKIVAQSILEKTNG